MKKIFYSFIMKSLNKLLFIRMRLYPRPPGSSLYISYPEVHSLPHLPTADLAAAEAGLAFTVPFWKSPKKEPAGKRSNRLANFVIYLGSALLSVALFLIAPPANALGLNCNVSSTGVAYGVYDSTSSSSTNATGNVHVFCTVLLVSVLSQINISLSPGSSGTFAPRKMSNGSDQLNYNLYKDAAHTTVWGDGTGGTGIFTDNLLIAVLGTSVDHTIYGSIPPGQYAAAGSYSDTITVTVEFHEGI